VPSTTSGQRQLQTSLSSLDQAIRASWCLWTSDPVDQPGWSDSNPRPGSAGQLPLLAARVFRQLGGETTASAPLTVTVKGVCVRAEPRSSSEHVSVAFLDPAQLDAEQLPATYRQMIARSR
jgi:hypothetical protein